MQATRVEVYSKAGWLTLGLLDIALTAALGAERVAQTPPLRLRLVPGPAAVLSSRGRVIT
jgi:hypothetical protein